MGNEGSRLKDLVIDKTAVEANDFFSLHDGDTTLDTTIEGQIAKLSIFRGERNNTATVWGAQGAMKHGIKSLMIYRHPYILKYITTWEKSGEVYLATERVRPLASVLNSLTDIQICLGLRTVLCALIFLTERAMARHLNICTASIYITDNGSWRLGGFEHVWKSTEVKKSLLELLRQYRYEAAIDPDELKSNENINTIEQYSFATLCIEILSKKNKKKTSSGFAAEQSDCETPHAAEFREYCAKILRTKKPDMRPKLAAVLLHPYFNHEFVLIHSFLFELPLKNLSEKQSFFTSLVDRLRYFNEKVVAAQLSGDLLSRMVLLDPTAQLCVTPYVLKTKGIDNTAALFSRETYSEILVPKILRMFRLRDAQIRLILLEYFMEFVRLLTEKEIKEFILPHLLDGMNDTNDVLVAKTLRCLADLIPILGAQVVLGERMRLFSDGRPQAATTAESSKHWVEPRSITPVLTHGNNVGGGGINSDDDDDDNDVDFMVSGSPLPNDATIHRGDSFNSIIHSELIDISNADQELLEMPTRLSPDGGEDDISTIVADGICVNSGDEISMPTCISNGDLIGEGYDSVLEEEEKGTVKNIINIPPNDIEDPWSDWEADEELQPTKTDILTIEQENFKMSVNISKNIVSIVDANTKRALSKQINDDLNTLDIQVQKVAAAKSSSEKRDEFDFFKDMEPVIEASTITNTITNSNTAAGMFKKTATKENEDETVLIDKNRFAAVAQYNNLTDGNDSFVNEETLNDGDGNGWEVDEVDDSACLNNNP